LTADGFPAGNFYLGRFRHLNAEWVNSFHFFSVAEISDGLAQDY